ncbi:hypothetical protein FA95DRAFT_934567 [Auriscalpium vulgare]|uniref:Uncharacterized protein n=1 Tax=Auriscalpium vulgare TaxID=40419 RepID=A0ACB8SBD7_9AGAM|nr:hypothetical protein FA95DRAFT_934567 [Auriscalpium vulgare]
MDTPTHESDGGYSTQCSTQYDGDEDFQIAVQQYHETPERDAVPVAPDPFEGSTQVLGKREASPSSPRPYKRIRLSDKLAGGAESASGSHASSFESLTLTPGSATEAIPISSQPYIVAYDDNVTRWIDKRDLPWPIQWEIMRLVTAGKIDWGFPLEKIDKLVEITKETPRSPNASIAPGLEDYFVSNVPLSTTRRLSNELKARAPWSELDKELLAFRLSPFGCLGVEGGVSEEDWYGGKAQFSMKISVADSNLRLTLDQPELGSSSRFTRRFGSDSVIRVRVGKDALGTKHFSKLEELLLRPFVLGSRVYRFFYANKERNVFLMATNEKYVGGSRAMVEQGPRTALRMSVFDFLSWHNPLEGKPGQSLAKWAARNALGLSNSIPGVLVAPGNIRSIPEIYSTDWKGGGKVPSEMEMTDGCGLVNSKALFALLKKDLWDQIPTAFQFRIKGAKGVLLRHPGTEENEMTEPCIWLRPSQIKIEYPNGVDDPAQLTIDVLRASRLQTPVRLSKEALINLAENGVPHEVFKNLLKLSLEETVEGLTNWDGDDGLRRLWAVVAKEGGVLAARMAREAAGTARVRGLRSYDREQNDSDGEEEDQEGITIGGERSAEKRTIERSAAWWGDEVSGCPSSLEETVCAMLDAGFEPESCPVLAAKHHEVAKKAVKSQASKCRIMIPMACSGIVVPDPCGVLKEGEIHVKTSSHNFRMPDGQYSDKLTCDVLVTRNPCKLPTDVQKVKAVFAPELDAYSNVIVFSTQGSRSLASLLAGGDYDGDRVEVIWDPAIVAAFKNADVKYATPPADLDADFEFKNETVAEFLACAADMSEVERTRKLQQVLMEPLREPFLVGAYSSMHDNAIYRMGYDHKETIRLAYMFCTILDGAKTGLNVKPEVYKQDNGTHSGQATWKRHNSGLLEGLGQKKLLPEAGRIIQRPKALGKFVMDVLLNYIRDESDVHLATIQTLFKGFQENATMDMDLVMPWKLAAARAKKIGEPMEAELKIITEHVEQVRREVKQRKEEAAVHFTTMRIETRQDILRQESRKFASVPAEGQCVYFSQEEVLRVRASYAYYHDWQQRWSRFPFDVAMRELGAIKARALGSWKPITSSYYDRFTIRNSIR